MPEDFYVEEINERDRSDREMLQEILSEQRKTNELLDKIVTATNSNSEALNWLTTNTAGLFQAFADMQANGGPAALLAGMGRKNG